MEYQEHEQRQSEEQQAVPPSLLPSVLRRLGLGDAPTTRVEEQIAALGEEPPIAAQETRRKQPRGSSSWQPYATRPGKCEQRQYGHLVHGESTLQEKPCSTPCPMRTARCEQQPCEPGVGGAAVER